MVPGLVRTLSVAGVGLGGLLVCGDGDGQAEGLQAAEVGADLLIPVGVAGVEVRAEVAVGGRRVGEQVPDDDHDGAGDGDLGDGLAAAAGDPRYRSPRKVAVPEAPMAACPAAARA